MTAKILKGHQSRQDCTTLTSAQLQKKRQIAHLTNDW